MVEDLPRAAVAINARRDRHVFPSSATLAVAVAPGWKTILVLRFLAGVALSGVPAVATAYLAEEVEPQSLGSVMGLYIGGNAVGGMAGRLLTGVLADATHSWRWSVGIVAALGLVAALVFIRLLPAISISEMRELARESAKEAAA